MSTQSIRTTQAWPFVQSNRCLLRPAQVEDFAALEAAVSNPTFPQDLPLASMRREGELMPWLERFCQAKPGPVLWSITSGASHECVGQVALVPQPSPSQWWLSYWLTPAHWGQGLAREAVSSLLAQAFKQPLYATIVAVVGTSNGRSVKLLKALGFYESLDADKEVSIPTNHACYKLVRGVTK